MNADEFNRELFERAFSAGAASCRVDCPCGKIYWDETQTGVYEEGELAELESDLNAVAVDYSIQYVEFNGRQYSASCDCWVPVAKQIASFLIEHDSKVAKYLNGRKKKAVEDANGLPEVKP